jgi:hypothetical protein
VRTKRLRGLILMATAMALVAAPVVSAKSEVPPELAGRWTIVGPSGGTQFLVLADSRFSFFSPDFPDVPAFGEVAVSGNTLTFFSSNRCQGMGTYEWSLSGGGLTFVEAASSKDPCAGRRVFLQFDSWTR